jgi:hypothetical protein
MYLIRAARWHDPAELRRRPQLWRRVRRFNLPVQLAVAAAEEVAAHARDPAAAALLSLAPCHSGSPDLFAGVLALAVAERGQAGTLRVNPVVTLHAVDNLALSALAISLGNHAYGLGLGGGPGQAWVALEVAGERLADGRESEVLIVAGDQDVAAGDTGEAVALLFADRPVLGEKSWRLKEVRRTPDEADGVEPHAAAGLSALLAALAAAKDRLDYRVPAAHADGRDRVELEWEAA